MRAVVGSSIAMNALRFIPNSGTLALALATATGAVTATTLPAFAQEVQSQTIDDSADAMQVRAYPERAHLIRGTVASFSPYRILLAEGPERTTQVDLNKGTAILPVGTTITPGMHLMVHGMWSKGVFVADRVMLRRDGD